MFLSLKKTRSLILRLTGVSKFAHACVYIIMYVLFAIAYWIVDKMEEDDEGN